MCKRAIRYDFINHSDRLTTPLIRKDGELVEATWDEALDLVVNTFGQIKRNMAQMRWESSHQHAVRMKIIISSEIFARGVRNKQH